MGFMEPEITRDLFVAIDGAHGITNVPADVLNAACLAGLRKRAAGSSRTEFNASELDSATLRRVAEFYDGPADSIESVALVEGIFARLTAPGYLDATDWNGPFESERAAREFLAETYGLDEGDDMDAEDEA